MYMGFMYRELYVHVQHMYVTWGKTGGISVHVPCMGWYQGAIYRCASHVDSFFSAAHHQHTGVAIKTKRMSVPRDEEQHLR
jgi:hypothetical protein